MVPFSSAAVGNFHSALDNSDDRAISRKLEDIFYSELRCNLVHEAELKEVGFSTAIVDNDQVVASLSVPALPAR